MNRKVAIDFAEQTIAYANRPFSEINSCVYAKCSKKRRTNNQLIEKYNCDDSERTKDTKKTHSRTQTHRTDLDLFYIQFHCVSLFNGYKSSIVLLYYFYMCLFFFFNFIAFFGRSQIWWCETDPWPRHGCTGVYIRALENVLGQIPSFLKNTRYKFSNY